MCQKAKVGRVLCVENAYANHNADRVFAVSETHLIETGLVIYPEASHHSSKTMRIPHQRRTIITSQQATLQRWPS